MNSYDKAVMSLALHGLTLHDFTSRMEEKKKKQTQQGSLNTQEKKSNLTARKSQKKSFEIKVQIQFNTCKGEGNKNLSIKHAEETSFLLLIENVNLFKKQTRGPNRS